MENRDKAWRISVSLRKPNLRALVTRWFVPLLLTLLSVFGAFQLLDALDVVYYPMINGASGTRQFDLGLSLVTPLLSLLLTWSGWIIWRKRFLILLVPILAIGLYPFTSLEVVASMGSLFAVAGSLWSHRRIRDYLSCALLLLGSIEVFALLHWAVFLPLDLSSPFRWYANLEMGLFYLAALLAPYLAILMMSLWVFKLLLNWKWGNKEKHENFDKRDVENVSRKAILMLLFSMSLGFIAALYPHLSSVNSRNRDVGVDFSLYVEEAKLVEQDLSQVFNVWGSSRPFIHLVIYSIQVIFRLDVSTAVRCLPLFLNPLLAFSTYFFAREIFLDEWVASLASFFTICGIQMTVGMFSYFMANILALSIVFLSLGFLFRAIRCGWRFSLIIASLIGGLMVFTHPWTFDQYFATVVLTSFFVLYDDGKRGKGYGSSRILLFYILSLGLSELIKSKIFHGLGGVTASSLAIGSIVQVSRFWYNTIFSFRRIYGGLESNVILIILSIVGIFILTQVSVAKVYLIFFLVVSSLPFFICNAMIKSRLVYNIPVGLYSAYGFTWLTNHRSIDDFKLHLNFFVLFSMIVYLFRSIANIV